MPPLAAKDSDGDKRPSLVVGVGASAGGLDALRRLLKELPADLGLAVVIVQHLRPDHPSALGDLLASHTSMPVVRVDRPLRPTPDTAYVLDAGTELTLADGTLTPTPRRQDPGAPHLPVDRLFRSLAHELGHGAAGILLSGAGSDGVAGLRALREVGALTLAQQPADAEHASMPQSAVDAGVVDLVLPIAQMPRAIARFLELPREARALDAGEGPEAPVAEASEPIRDALEQAAMILRDQGAFDLKHYKPGTVRRRFLRRMALAGFDDVAPYLHHLRESTPEQRALMRSLLIGVTDFFRNPPAFDVLRQTAVEPLVRSATNGDTLRAWVAGCATGEEAYSLGMVLLDAIDASGKALELQVFATDMDEDALAVARAGLYPTSVSEEIPAPFLAKFMSPVKQRGYQVGQRLRDVMSFAVHDLCNDPPFSRMHLVSCRNVLIYLRPATQQHVLSALHFALHPGGHLFLGTSEAPGGSADEFETVSSPWRIYRKVGPTRSLSLSRTAMAARLRPVVEPAKRTHPPGPASWGLTQAAKEALLEAKVPPSLVVTHNEHVLYAHGDLSRFVRFPQGEPKLELGHVLQPDLITRVRAALYKARREGSPVSVTFDPGRDEGDACAGSARVTVQAAPRMGDGAMVISFEPGERGVAPAPMASPSPAQEAVMDQLEAELEATREDLRNTSEELQSTNEELRASHEEAMTMNEELQSANEELEATTEELRSLNEELATANTRLKDKVDELARAHDDLSNFFASARIPMLFLDEQLRVQRLSPDAQGLLGLGDADLGRPVGNIDHALMREGLQESAAEVLAELAPVDQEIHTAEGRWYARRILPYRTKGRRIDGVVVTFLDVTDLKAATERLRQREAAQAVIARLGVRALEEDDLQGFLDQTVREVQKTLDTDFCKVLECLPGGEQLLLRAGVGWAEGLVGHGTVGTDLDSQAGYTLSIQEPVVVHDMSTERRFRGPALLHEHGVVSGISCVIESAAGAYGVLGAHTRTHRTFTDEDAHFLQAVANVVSNAIGRALTKQRLAVERRVATALAEAATVEDVLTQVQGILRDELAIELCEVWLPTASDDALLTCTRVVGPDELTRDSEALRKFSTCNFQAGEGLVGRAWQERQALWVPYLEDPQAFTRSAGAKRLGLQSGFAFPLRAGPERLGVIACYARRRLTTDALLMRSLEGVGRGIGELMHRLRSEEALRTSEARYRNMFENVGVSLWEQDFSEIKHILDAALAAARPEDVRQYLTEHSEVVERCMAALRLGEMNRETLRLFAATSKEELVGSFERVLLTEEAHGALLEQLVALAEGRELLAAESRVRTLAGDILDVAYTIRFPPASEGYDRVLVSVVDISDRKSAVQALREADRQKDEYLAMLGHELRNPLSAIRTAAELLRLVETDEPDIQDARQVIDRQSWHMAKLLDGLLDVSRIVRGKFSLDMETVDLVALLRGVLQDQEGSLRERGLTLDVHVNTQAMWLRGDPVRLTQAFANLLSNAAKYTDPPGSIEVTIDREGADAVVRVRDTGAGMDPQLVPHIFEPFHQGPQTIDRRGGGLGLGLALVKGVVELHGGVVWARSPGLGQGSEFGFRLPLTAHVPSTVPPSAGQGAPCRVLVVEDNEDAADLLCRLLERLGHQVSVAHDGEGGLAMARAVRPQVILCDIGLPGELSGYDVARAIREGAQADDHVLLVAITGYGRPEDQQAAQEAGFDAHLTKPVDLASLEQVLARVPQDSPSRE